MDANVTVFTGTAEQFEEFERMLAEPLPATDKLDKLFARPSIFNP